MELIHCFFEQKMITCCCCCVYADVLIGMEQRKKASPNHQVLFNKSMHLLRSGLGHSLTYRNPLSAPKHSHHMRIRLHAAHTHVLFHTKEESSPSCACSTTNTNTHAFQFKGRILHLQTCRRRNLPATPLETMPCLKRAVYHWNGECEERKRYKPETNPQPTHISTSAHLTKCVSQFRFIFSPHARLFLLPSEHFFSLWVKRAKRNQAEPSSPAGRPSHTTPLKEPCHAEKTDNYECCFIQC